MSLLNEVTPYSPAPLWQPEHVYTNLLEAFGGYTPEPSATGEARLAQTLALQSHQYVGIYSASSPFYRAHIAIDHGQGNCMAHTEVTAAIADNLDLDTFITWGGNHASILWLARLSIWDIDGYFGSAKNFVHTLPSAAQSEEIVREFREASEKDHGLYMGRRADGSIEVVEAPDPLSQTENPFDTEDYAEAYIHLPLAQGITMLSALGDLSRYRNYAEDKYYARRDQILHHLPRDFEAEHNSPSPQFGS